MDLTAPLAIFAIGQAFEKDVRPSRVTMMYLAYFGSALIMNVH
ncbi:hypothetical protein JCM19239_7839 [Vibrio variabilis]|uniref:Arginine/ornithine antiporter ArcD n=1 Tax=Vibrio variabilis TaxID=990271 RepID=A0ABQ0JMH4_9VIBR|nr:hypothetical protein JCM19239_7839 [Vibrio variabilis]